jgi:kynurenine formamidase
MSVSDFWQHDLDGWQISQVTFVSSSGTYLDAPLHRFPDGDSVADLPLQSCSNIEGIKIVTDEVRIEDAILDTDADAVAGKAVLIQTGWSNHWGTEKYGQTDSHPGLTAAAGKHLRDSGAVLVGIDSVNIDYMRDEGVGVHETLLRAGIPIVEQLTNVAALPDEGFRFFAVPLPFEGTGTCPVRAFALLTATE